MSLQLPDHLRSLVTDVGDPITPDDLQVYERLQDVSDRSYKLRTIVDAWGGQNTEERKMRRQFASAILIALFFQILIVNVSFFLIGLGILEVTEWVAQTFIISVFGEIVGMTMLVLRYLFPKIGSDVLELLKNL